MVRKMMMLAVAVLLVASAAQAEVLFIHGFNDISSATREERLTADYAKGNAVPVLIAGLPDNLTTAGDPQPALFGESSLRGQHNGSSSGDRLAYQAQDNFNGASGTVEMWYRPHQWSQHDRLFQFYGNAGHRVYLQMSRLDGTNNLRFHTQFASGGQGIAVQTTHVDSLFDRTAGEWLHVLLEWDMSSSLASQQNYAKLWVGGELIAEMQLDVGEWTLALTDAHRMYIGTRSDGSGDHAVVGYINEVRITDGKAADFYEIDANGSFQAPTGTFIPEPGVITILGGGALAMLRRRR